MNNKLNLVELIKYIDPSRLDYQEWINVGMALKQEGYSEYDWECHVVHAFWVFCICLI